MQVRVLSSALCLSYQRSPAPCKGGRPGRHRGGAPVACGVTAAHRVLAPRILVRVQAGERVQCYSRLMPYADPQLQREYQVEWVAARRQRAVILLGAKCTWCERTENLEFDHIDPSSKNPILKLGRGTGSFWSWAWSRIEAELQKCWLLCEDCHRVKTRDDRPDLLHGTRTMYQKRKCRCQECSAWQGRRMDAYRMRKSQAAVAQMEERLPGT